jgi:hypothetical protein
MCLRAGHAERTDVQPERRVQDEANEQHGQPRTDADDGRLRPAAGVASLDDGDPRHQRDNRSYQRQPRRQCPRERAEQRGEDRVSVAIDAHDEPGTDINGQSADKEGDDEANERPGNWYCHISTSEASTLYLLAPADSS